MKLKTAKNIEWTVRLILSIIEFPFVTVKEVIRLIVEWIVVKPVDVLIVNPTDRFCHWLGNRLLLNSEEVKDGTICNPDVLKYNAYGVYHLWKKEQEKK